MKLSFPDLTEYKGCSGEGDLGMLPLAVGWLSAKHLYTMGKPSNDFVQRLTAFCRPEHTVCHTPGVRPCPLCGQKVLLDGEPLGSAEIRVLGEEDIFAAPDLIIHFITAHGYMPPPVFLFAVLKGSPPGSPEHRALVNVLR
jgi:hypothetical protein